MQSHKLKNKATASQLLAILCSNRGIANFMYDRFKTLLQDSLPCLRCHQKKVAYFDGGKAELVEVLEYFEQELLHDVRKTLVV